MKHLLLPREKYAEESKKYGPSPFTFEIERDGQVLYYFGANHSRDPKNVQYSKLKEYWEGFLYKTNGQKRIVLIEGGLRRLREDEKSAIESGSEGGLVTLLVHRAGVDISSPDLEDQLLPEFDQETAMLYWFLSWVDNWQKNAEPKPDFNKSAEIWREDRRQRAEWKDCDISIDRLKSLYREIIGKEFSEFEIHNDLINPNKTGTLINEFARTKSDLRDEHIVSEIKKHWKEGKSIFAVFGSGHLIIQRPALEAL